MTSIDLPAPQVPPNYCQYVNGPCNQTFMAPTDKPKVFFAYASQPTQIADSINTAITKLNAADSEFSWVGWTDMQIQGQLIFCEICKEIRSASVVVADITTLNFNLIFEIGVAISLGVPVVLLRDASYTKDQDAFRQLGLLDTIGYTQFENSDDLERVLPDAVRTATALADIPQRAFRESPVYIVRPTITPEGHLQLESTLKKSRLKYRAYDPKETIRLTINDARRQVNGSLAVVALLLDSQRAVATIHNALCAFLAGFAIAREKIVVLLQEGESLQQPIDYRDVVTQIDLASRVPALIKPALDRVYDVLQTTRFDSPEVNELGVLKDLDLGDVAAENEISGLQQYFVPTGQSIAARQGHARLVIGRKGSGKSAIFYEVRASESRGLDEIVLDLRPEGHQFTRLKEYVEGGMSEGLREYALTGFWTYLLLTEIARKLLEIDSSVAKSDPERYRQFTALQKVYDRHNPGDLVDFPQRLIYHVSSLVTANSGEASGKSISEAIMESLYRGDVRELRDAVVEYVARKRSVWLLIDNLDKGWPIGGSTTTDILLLRCLLDSTRKLQRDHEDRGVEFKCLVFLRSDIYENLIEQIPDKGKDTAIRLDWTDDAIFERLVERRIVASTDLTGTFRESLWPSICAPLIGTEDSFSYLVDRTLRRPRDLLLFLHRAVDTAINRGHNRITEEDLKFAENGYSQDMLQNLHFEISDLNPSYGQALEAFAGAEALSLEEALLHLEVYGGFESVGVARPVVDLLLRYGFLGVIGGPFKKVQYVFDLVGGLQRLAYPLENGEGSLVVHPAFRAALDISY